MGKIGIKKVGFIEQNEINDNWMVAQQEAPPQRGGTAILTTGVTVHMFGSIDQGNTSLQSELEDSENGFAYKTALSLKVRTDSDIRLGNKYLNRPVVMCVWTVDGTYIEIGTKPYPARMTGRMGYDAMGTRELTVNVDYQSVEPLF